MGIVSIGVSADEMSKPAWAECVGIGGFVKAPLESCEFNILTRNAFPKGMYKDTSAEK